MPLSRRGYPVCLLYPWPWWQANKTPGPVLQDIDDSADFDSPSHYNYYNGTFNSTPSINDFISQRERSGRERYTPSVTCILSVCARLSFFFANLLSFSIIRKAENVIFARNFRVSMKGDGIYRVVWFILWTNVSRDVEPGFLSPDVGWQRVTQVFAVYAAINCRWRSGAGRFWKCLEIFVEGCERAEMQGTRFDLKDRAFRVLTGLEIAIVKYFVAGG